MSQDLEVVLDSLLLCSLISQLECGFIHGSEDQSFRISAQAGNKNEMLVNGIDVI